jgi:hypothetical protein
MAEQVLPTGAKGESPAAFRSRLQTVKIITSGTQPSGDRLGYLHSCIDRRFVKGASDAFSTITDLAPTQFWQGATAGGAALIRGSIEALATIRQERDVVAKGIEHARNHGATVWGWQAHGDKCGGLPGAIDSVIEDRLHDTAQVASEILPGQHYVIFSTEGLAVAKRVTR